MRLILYTRWVTDRMKERGILYGVGVGPGDPELMTYKAIKTIEDCEIIAVPNVNREKSVSYRIAAGIIHDIDKKICIDLGTPMTKDKEVLNLAYEKAASRIAGYLAEGKSIAYLTLGDPCVYSTYMYIERKVRSLGYETRIINGIPSFCAAASRMNESLADRNKQIHIIPSSYDIEQALEFPGTKVFMKAGKKLADVKAMLIKKGITDCYMIENCGMPDEKIYSGADKIPENAGYYSIIIIRH